MPRPTAGQVPRERLVSPPSPTTQWAATHLLDEFEADDGSMHDLRTSPALRTLAELTGDAVPSRWNWSIGRLDRAGRLCLGSATATALGPGPLGLRWHHLALVLEPDSHPAGRMASLDERGRFLAPAWLRQRGRDVLVGLDRDGATVLIAPVEVLDRLGDVLVGGSR